MFRHYLTIALRGLKRQKLYSIINVLGLSIGIGLCALLFLYVQDELSFDSFHENGDRIVRVTQFDYTPDGGTEGEHVWHPYPFGEALEKDHPLVEHVVRMDEEEVYLRTSGEPLPQTVYFVDRPYFDVFTFPLIAGDPSTALDNPNSMVMTEAAARRFFGTTDILNRTLDVRFETQFETVTITGVMADIPGNSSLPFEVIMPFHKLPDAFEWIAGRTDRWNASSFPTFALLTESADIDEANAILPTLRRKYYPDEIQRWRDNGWWEGDGPVRGYRFQPLSQVHLDTSVQGGFVPASNPLYSWILGGIAIGILLLACINFTTLAIGRSARRAPEIGLRKAVGARYEQILSQFGGEALIFGLIGAVGAVMVAELMLPTLNALSGKELSLDLMGRPLLLVALPLIGLAAGLLAGIYPAVVLARLRPTASLRRRSRLGGSGRLTRTLVVLQFSLSITLIAGTFIMNEQMRFIRNTDLGYRHDKVMVVALNDVPHERIMDRFDIDLAARSGFGGMAGVNLSFNRGYSRIGWDYRDQEKTAYHFNVTSGFVDLLDMDVIAGRNFDAELSTDSSAVVVNQALVDDFGWSPEEAVGQVLEGVYGDPTIIGVVGNFHARSLHEPVLPVFMTMKADEGIRYVLIRLDTPDVSGAISSVRASWDAAVPETPLEYSFLDDDLARQYESEQRWSRIVGYSAGIAVLIACLGLFGLATLSVAGRTKEIGIRKVLGASASTVFRLLTKDFVLLVALSSLIAVPVAYVGTQRWLETFAYRIEIGALGFGLAIACTLVISIGVVSYQSIRAAHSNPVDSLRYE